MAAIWHTRLYRPGDERALVHLLKESFPGWPNAHPPIDPDEHLQWKLSSRDDARHYQVIADHNGNVVGCQHFFLQRVLVQGRLLASCQGVDLAVRPEYRGQGIMEGMRRFFWDRFENSIDIHFGRTANASLQRLREREGREPFANAVEVLTWQPTGAAMMRPSAGDASPSGVRTAHRFDYRVDALARRIACEFDFIVARDEAYLNWRYADPRAGHFTIRIAEAAGDLEGYSVLSASRGRAHVADILALPGRPDVLDALVNDAVTLFTAGAVNSADVWMSVRHPFREAFLAHRFVSTGRFVPLVCGSLCKRREADLAFLRNPRAAVHFSSGDSDLI